jgi:predicted phosphodiesterase
MRIAILSDIHDDLTAFEAVLADLQHTSPDLILHGGDLADAKRLDTGSLQMP